MFFCRVSFLVVELSVVNKLLYLCILFEWLFEKIWILVMSLWIMVGLISCIFFVLSMCFYFFYIDVYYFLDFFCYVVENVFSDFFFKFCVFVLCYFYRYFYGVFWWICGSCFNVLFYLDLCCIRNECVSIVVGD